jgi:hypothetical protein
MPMEPVWLQGGCALDPRRFHRCGSSDAEGGDPGGSNAEKLTCSECGNGWPATVVSPAVIVDDRTAVSHVLAEPRAAHENRTHGRSASAPCRFGLPIGLRSLWAMLRAAQHWATCQLWRRQSIVR